MSIAPCPPAKPLVIAVDGPAASGKGTIARALARHYGLPHLDTGKLYRAAAFALLHDGADPHDAAAAAAAAQDFDDSLLTHPALTDSMISETASIVSAHPAVRAALYDRQRAFAARPGGAVLDGRDIGTVIAPCAPAKLFITASATVRAERRHRELLASGERDDFAAVLAAIEARDARDSARTAAPLVRATDAALLDTSDLVISAAVARAILLVDTALGVNRQH